MVNLAKFDEHSQQGLVFYTDRGSRKVVDLEENKYVSSVTTGCCPRQLDKFEY